jgi:dUTP pyrophosphatase
MIKFFYRKGEVMTVLKIEKLPHNKVLPEYKTEGAAGMDLCAAIDEPIELKPLERKLIPTGLKIELEHGFEAQIRPRSGMSIKHGITLINCVGTIDEDYRGEVCVPIVNISNEAYTIQPQERIAQMVIARVEQAKIEVVTELTETVRGEGGFGSTGKK